MVLLLTEVMSPIAELDFIVQKQCEKLIIVWILFEGLTLISLSCMSLLQ